MEDAELDTKTIRLPRGNWIINEARPLGPAGGFGQVFEGAAPDGTAVALKRLKIDASASGYREVEIVDALVGRKLHHVVPVYDAGLDADSGRFYVVMARAESSLRNRLDELKHFPETEVAAILDAIAQGLNEIEDVVHRDLKPDNVLLHEGVWKLADLGIARFTEEATSSNTMKDCLSPPYAAPEQWRGEHATHATDVYAFGCAAFELLEGRPPFRGPTAADYARQHLNELPPQAGCSSALRLLISNCLRKAGPGRPSLGALVERLAAIRSVQPTQAAGRIAEAAAAVAHQQAEADARRAVERARASQRKALAQDGIQALGEIVELLLERLDLASQGTASSVSSARPRNSREMLGKQERHLGRGELRVFVAFPEISESAFPNSKLKIVAGAVITVRQADHPFCGGRGANLWFGDLRETGTYSWFEQSYMISALLPRESMLVEPFGVSKPEHLAEVDRAHSMMATLQRASKLRLIEGSGVDPFIERWLERFAMAAQGQLQKPNPMPDEDVNAPE
jgi:eukaryotic-like serine/threonine-protein kinase